MSNERTTPRENHDRAIVKRAADTARRAGRATIRRGELTMGKGPKVRNVGGIVK